MNPEDALINGTKILEKLMAGLGFNFSLVETGKGSGGTYAIGQYSKGDRTLELHYRYNLGLVNYRIDNHIISHEDFMRAQGRYGENKYPGFSDAPNQQFINLLFDLKRFGSTFLTEPEAEFIKLVSDFNKEKTNYRGFKGLGKF